MLVFGGTDEVTISTVFADTRSAGVVSTEPAHLMNAFQLGEHIVNVALTGRVPCKVVGKIEKGDRLVTSSIPGVATVLVDSQFKPGCIIGKALQTYDADQVGTIEIAVGRV